MTATKTLLDKYRLFTKNKNIKQQRYRIYLLKSFQFHNQANLLNKSTMSKSLVRELDFKMQQVREYGLIAHGYHNENFQYPVHVRRSHDGEKLSRTTSNKSKTTNHHSNKKTSTILYDNQKKDISTIIIPPNKTIDDINSCEKIYSQRKSSLTITNSSPILYPTRPHSIAGISLSAPSSDEQEKPSLSNSSQSLINSSVPPTKTLTQRFLSKLFHQSSKS